MSRTQTQPNAFLFHSAASALATLGDERRRLSLYFNDNRPDMAAVREVTALLDDGRKVGVRIYDPGVPSAPAPCLVALHGYGWYADRPQRFENAARHLAESGQLLVATVDYADRGEPISGLSDCLGVLRWLTTDGSRVGVDPKHLAVIGERHGAALALACCRAERDDLELRAGLLLFGDYDEPVELHGTPPLYFATGPWDPSREACFALAERARGVDPSSCLVEWPGVPLAPLELARSIPELQPYLDAMTVYLRGLLAEDSP